MPGILADITGGGAFAIVPVDALRDGTLSRDARWLFALLCGHADRTGLCRRSLRRLAEEQGVSRRSLQRWLGELEAAGRIVRVDVPGRVGQFRVVRDPAGIEAGKTTGRERSAERRARFIRQGQHDGSVRHGTGDTAVTPQPVDNSATGDWPVTGGVTAASPPPVTRLSPRTRPHTTRPSEQSPLHPVDRDTARERMTREQAVRQIVQATCDDRSEGPVPVGAVLRRRLSEVEIDAFVTGARPLDELRRLLADRSDVEDDRDPEAER